jgi:hypothetical protein
MSSFTGHRPAVGVSSRETSPLEQKARELLLGKKVTGVFLNGDQLLIQLEDGSSFVMNCSGGFNEVQ